MRFLSSFLLVVPLLSGAVSTNLDNSSTHYDASGSTQTSRPVTHLKWFAQGEIPNCPRAYDGATPLTSQADVRTRWSDGSVQQVVMSYKFTVTGNSSKKVNFRDTGASCVNTGYLTYAQISALTDADAQVEITSNSITHTMNLKTMLVALGSISTDQESLGAFYTLRGAVATEIVVRDNDPTTRQFCVGYEWDFTTGNWKTPTLDQYKSLCPSYHVTIYPDTPTAGLYAIKIRAVMENTWTDRLQTQTYAATVKVGAALTTWSATQINLRHQAKTIWTVGGYPEMWAANQPGSIQTDYNFKHLISSKALIQYDTSIAAVFSAINTDLTTTYTNRITNGTPLKNPTWIDGVSGATGSAYLWNKVTGTGGGRKDMGVMGNQNALSYMYMMGDTGISVANRKLLYDRFIIALAEVGSLIPIKYREGKTTLCGYRADGDTSGKLFASGACTLNAGGRPLSVTARPLLWANTGNNSTLDEDVNFDATSDAVVYSYPTVTFSAVSGNPTLTLTAGSIANDQKVRGRFGPSSLNSISAPYYVVNSSGSTFQLSATQGGAAINSGTTGSGYKLVPYDAQVPIGGSSVQSNNYWQWNDATPLGHYYEWFQPAYLLTGDWFYLEMIQFHGSYAHAALRALPKTVANPNFREGEKALIYYRGNQRMSSSVMVSFFNSQLFTPDGLLLKSHYQQKWKNNVALREGLFGITTAAGGLYQGDAVRGSIWTIGQSALQTPGAAFQTGGYMHDTQGLCATTGTPPYTLEGVLNEYCGSWKGFYEWYVRIGWGRFSELDSTALLFTKKLMESAQAEATTTTGNWTIHHSAEYNYPNQHYTDKTLLFTPAQYDSGMTKSCTLTADINSSVTTFLCNTPNYWWNNQLGRTVLVDSEYMVLNGGTVTNKTSGFLTFVGVQRGARGSTPAAHLLGATATQIYDNWVGIETAGVHSYPHIWAAALSFEYFLGDALPGWQAMLASSMDFTPLVQTQGFAIRPRDQIRSLDTNEGGESAIITYTLPLNGSCGKIRVSTSPIAGGDSDDTSDTAVGGSGTCSYNATGLSTGTLYYGRLSGAGTYGNAREFFTFTTTGAGAPLQILTTSCPAGTQGVAYSCTVLITGGTGPFTHSTSVGTLPAGLSLNTSTGAITGTPSGSGTTNFTHRVVDSAAGDQSQALSIAIAGVVTITTTTLPGGTTGQSYSQQLAATGGTPPYAWTVTVGAVPVGTALSSSGLLSGVTTDVETAAFTVTATDSLSATDTQALTVAVVAPQSMTLAFGNDFTYLLHQVAFSETLSRVGGTAPYTFALVGGTLPSGFTLNASTGEVGGTATLNGNYAVTIKVTDDNGVEAFASTTFVVYTLGSSVEIVAESSTTSALLRLRLAGLNANLTGNLVVRDETDQAVAYSETIAAGPAVRYAVATSLLPSTNYRAEVVYGTALATSGSVQFTTEAAAQSNQSWMHQVAVASVPGTTHLRLRYGGTSALGSTSSIAACVSGVCSVTLTRDSGPLWVADDRCADGACATILASSPARPHMIQ